MNNKKIEILQTTDQYLQNLKNGIIRLVNLMQEEKEQEAISLIPEISDGIEWIIKVIDLTKDIQKENAEMDNINEHLEAIVEALENEDYILVGDIFNYEVLPLLDIAHAKIRMTIAN